MVTVVGTVVSVGGGVVGGGVGGVGVGGVGVEGVLRRSGFRESWRCFNGYIIIVIKDISFGINSLLGEWRIWDDWSGRTRNTDVVLRSVGKGSTRSSEVVLEVRE